jgi:DNA-binding NarL/FixJ family response regulator
MRAPTETSSAPSPRRPIRVLVLEERADAGVVPKLEREPDIEVTATVASPREAARLAADATPDVVVVDVEQDAEAVTATAALGDGEAAAPVLAVVADGTGEAAVDALRAGAAGTCGRADETRGVAAAVRGVAAGHAVVSREVLRGVVSCVPGTGPLLGDCTPREREVLSLVASGATNPEICGRLTLSDATVRTHVRNLRRKLAARTRAELVSRAFRLGLAPQPSRSAR